MLPTAGTDGSIVLGFEASDETRCAECMIAGKQCRFSEGAETERTRKAFANVVQFRLKREADLDGLLFFIVLVSKALVLRIFWRRRY